ncbi:MAG: metalloprotease [Acidimicrobiia bacterium]
MLKFRFLGVPVGVHATFLFIAVLGAATYRGWDIVIFTLAALVSILAHEMGHALTAKAFHAKGVDVTLYGLGGVTTYAHGRNMSHGRSFLVSAAGSFVGIVLGGIVWLLARNGFLVDVNHEMSVFLNSLFFTSLVWGVLNWVPIVPLDGGHMVQSLAAMVNEEKAPLVGQIVTWIAVAIVVPLALSTGNQFAAIIVVLFALSGVRDYRRRADAARAAKLAERGVVTPDEVHPAPPSPPPSDASRPDASRPEAGRGDAGRSDSTDFPI